MLSVSEWTRPETMKLMAIPALCCFIVSHRLAAADVPVELQDKLNDSDLVVLSAGDGRSLFGIKGFGGNEILGSDKILVLRMTAKGGEPGLVIKTKGSPKYARYIIRDGSIVVDGDRVRISDLLDAMKIPKEQVAPVFIGKKPN
ncbi:MAG TPA: hypothetical protein VGE67_17135 [Haloferula sp.]